MNFPDSLDEVIATLEQSLFGLHRDAQHLYKSILTLKQQKEDHLLRKRTKNLYTIHYNPKEPVSKKIIFALYHLHRFAKMREIELEIRRYEPEFDKNLSTPLTILREEKKLISIKPTGSNRDTYYGLPQWTDEFNKPEPEYMYDTD